MTAGRVAALARYPVKSLGGEELAEAAFDVRGLAGDRLWSVRDADGRLGSGKTSSRFRRMDGLLLLEATYDGDVPVVTFPDGAVARGGGPQTDATLSRYVGRPVSLTRESDVPHFDDGPVHLVTTASLATLARAHGHPVPGATPAPTCCSTWRPTASPSTSGSDAASGSAAAWCCACGT